MLHQANNNYKCEEGTLYFKSCSRKDNEKEWRTCIRSREERREFYVLVMLQLSIGKPSLESRLSKGGGGSLPARKKRGTGDEAKVNLVVKMEK